MATRGRRYRSNVGGWTIPYVDDEQMVFLRHAQTGDGSLALVLGASIQFVGLALQGVHSTSLLLPVLGVIGTAFTIALVGLEPERIAHYSRLHVPRAPLVVRQVRSGSTLQFEAGLNGRILGPTSKRGIVHANLGNQERLLLVLGDEIIELWRSRDVRGGGETVAKHPWTLEHLAGGEGSAPIGEPEQGDGQVLPIDESLRRVLALGEGSETRLQGPKASAEHVVLGLAMILILPASYGLLFWRVRAWAQGTDSELFSVGFAAFAGAFYVLFELLVLHTYFRWVARRIDEVLGGIVSNRMFWVR
jgi:hypothetical protein